jgi:hypothetical protein
MYQKDVSNFTGFIATYCDGSVVKEKENFYSKKRNKQSKTNWLDIDKEKLVKLELYWKGVPSVSIDKEEHPYLSPEDWYFTHTGYMDIQDRNIKVLSRNIGFKKDGLLTIFSVNEDNGFVKVETRAS